MSEGPRKVHVGKVVKSSASGVSALDGVNALGQMVDAVRECIKIHEVESTKRADIAQREKTELARIKAAEDALRDYFERAFAERRTTYDALFTRLDAAVESGDADAMGAVVSGIVGLAQASPLKDVGDFGSYWAALKTIEL